ncbi:MAG TPA: protein translocase subunit SecD [Candidatus Kapabacteria bacterium]|nr:protein translocase subunit SecD [Candidatus Kapabacteria bacterium]
MNQNNFWKWALIVFIVGWALYEIYPPQSRPLVDQFAESAANRDTNFTTILTRARELETQRPNRGFQNLVEAIGTNDLRKYFTGFRVAENDPKPNRTILNRLQREAAGSIKLGLDLQGGTAFKVRMEPSVRTPGDTNTVDEVDRGAQIDQAIEVLRRRVDAFGVAEPIIQRAGEDSILVQLPGLSEAEIESARTAIAKPASLAFRIVHPQSDEYIRQGITPPGYERLTMRRAPRNPGEQEQVFAYLVKKTPEQGLIGKYVSRAGVTRDPISNQPLITMRFDSDGARIFGDVTRANVGRLLAIVLDGDLYSAPRINGPITGGNAQIEGDFSIKEALELSHVLMNPLETPLTIEEQRGVDPSLGKDSIRSGITASTAAAVLTFAFMLFFYFFAGMVANVALLLNVIILLGFMCSIGATLTLPGIAGIALTIGMAVDANVLIFERIREELAKGKSLRGALAAGYERAFGTILDSHVTTLITSVILIWKGTGPIKGFGVTLAIGVAISLFTALMVTRLIFNTMLDRNWIKSLKMLPIVKIPALDFLKGAKFTAFASIAIIIIGVGYAAFGRGADVLGVDFRGGDGATFRFAQKIDVDRMRDAVTKLNVGDPQIQYQRSVIDQSETLNIVSEYNSGEKVAAALQQQFPDAKLQLVGIDKVGPTVGAEIQKSAIVSSLIAFFCVLVYVAMRYEFGFAVAAVVATMHDVLVTMGIYFLKGGELSAPMVAAVLTIIGYSVNDKIVILDRIREDLKLGTRGSFRDVINLALNQTLSRTLITGGSVILATLALYLFGGGIINDFAFTFLIGILVGTYSSIYIAAPLVLKWYKGEKPGLAQTNITEQPVPARV